MRVWLCLSMQDNECMALQHGIAEVPGSALTKLKHAIPAAEGGGGYPQAHRPKSTDPKLPAAVASGGAGIGNLLRKSMGG